jgi:hypothetical protein
VLDGREQQHPHPKKNRHGQANGGVLLQPGARGDKVDGHQREPASDKRPANEPQRVFAARQHKRQADARQHRVGNSVASERFFSQKGESAHHSRAGGQHDRAKYHVARVGIAQEQEVEQGVHFAQSYAMLGRAPTFRGQICRQPLTVPAQTRRQTFRAVPRPGKPRCFPTPCQWWSPLRLPTKCRPRPAAAPGSGCARRGQALPTRGSRSTRSGAGIFWRISGELLISLAKLSS